MKKTRPAASIRSCLVAITMTPSEKKALQKAAKDAEKTVSSFVRDTALAAIGKK